MIRFVRRATLAFSLAALSFFSLTSARAGTGARLPTPMVTRCRRTPWHVSARLGCDMQHPFRP